MNNALRPRLARAAAAALLGVVPAVAPAAAQSGATAAVTGIVSDTAGTPLAGARVVLRDPATGAESAVLTDADGRFHLDKLPPGGPYTLTVTRLGAATLTRSGFPLRVGETLQLALELTEQPVALDVLEVAVAANPVMSLSRTGAATFVGEEMLARLPTLSRNVLEFAALSPLVRVEDGALSIAGQNNRYNSIRVDGALMQDVFGLSATGVPGGEAHAKAIPLAAVEQYQVLVAPFDVRQSGFTGGMLNVVTRSGTNEWEASAFGFARDERLLGDLTVGGVALVPDGFRRALAGFTLGGPLVRDRAHFFVAAELERRRTPTGGVSLGMADPLLTSLAPDSAQRMAELLRTRYDLDPGGFRRTTLENPIDNVFARVDVRLNDAHRLTLRHNYMRAENETTPNREPFDEYEFTSAGTRRASTTHATALHWFAAPAGRISNEFLLNFQHTRSRTRPGAAGPLVEVDVGSEFGDGVLFRRVRAGAALLAQSNELDQDVVQLTNDLTLRFGEHRLMLGTGAEYIRIRHLLFPGSAGRYLFDSLGDLAANTPSFYERNLLQPGVVDAAVRFSMLQFAGTVQDEWVPRTGLTLRLGLRLDVPVLPDVPAANAVLREAFGVNTAALPSPQFLFSPRIGFNWRPDPGAALQIRGGAGVFTGRPPLVWLANAYANTGLRTVVLTCRGANAPPLTSGEPPAVCRDGNGPAASTPQMIDFVDPEFRFPQDFRASIAVDRRLPFGFVGTLEAVYTRALRQVALEDVNLADPVADPQPDSGYSAGFGERAYYGTPTVAGFAPIRRDPRFSQVIRIGNDDGNYSYAISAELQRTVGENLTLRAGYAYARSGDTQSLISPEITENLGLTPAPDDPNRPPLRPSLFDQPHKVTLSAAARLPERWGAGEVTFLYVGQSGRPYSYVYLGDINGDGYPGNGVALDANNDLIYVPTAGFATPGGFATNVFMQQLVGLEPCLERFRGAILPRNHCRSPWSNQLDVRLVQPLRLAGAEFELTADVANLLNLLNADWGHVRRAAPIVPVLLLDGRREDDAEFFSPQPEPEDPLQVRYGGARRGDPDSGIGVAALPYTLATPASQWQVQLGVRIGF